MTMIATVQTVPEPSSVLLGCVGAVGLALAAWRRRTA
ncbi:MAG: PEP-CTERM sorting domain-containing protein [Planctomycetia bacterium]|nr:PEP-CTERM sorting domain-containing protein [Planctomycetia bacterium]